MLGEDKKMAGKIRPSPDLIEKWVREDEEARNIRRKYADWKFINKQKPKIKLALIIYIYTGDIYKAAKIAGVSIDEFNEIRIKAKIPNIT